MKKAATLFYNMCLCLTLLFSGIIFFRSLTLLDNVIPERMTRFANAARLALLPATFLLIAAMLLLFYNYCGKWLHKRGVSVVLAGILVFAQVCFLVFVSHPMYTTDTLRIHNEALAMLGEQNGILDIEASYFQQYPNNYFIVIWFYYYFTVLSRIGITNFWLAAVVLNVVCVDLGILFTYLAALKLRDTKFANLFLVLCIVCPTNYVWLTFAYTNTVSIPFVMGILYLFLQLKEHTRGRGQICRCILLGICIIIGYKLRPTTILPVIAMVLYTALKIIAFERNEQNEQRKHAKRKGVLLKCSVIIVTCILTAFASKRLVNKHVPSGYEDQNFPATHWIMMGLNEKNNGGFLGDDVTYSRSFPTKAERAEGHMKEIKRRLTAMGMRRYVRLIVHKLDRVWADGSDSSFDKASFARNYPRLYESVMGRDNMWFRIYTQGFRAATFFFISVCVLFQLLHKEQEDLFVYSLTLLGCIAFFILWEANCKYNICFMHICMLLMAQGVRKSQAGVKLLVELLRKRWRLFQAVSKPGLRIQAVIFCLACLIMVCFGARYSVIAGCNIQYVYRTEMQDKGFIGKKLLTKAVCIRQLLQVGQDCEKNCWNEMKLVFRMEDVQQAEDWYHVAVYSMPSKSVLYEADISRKQLNEKGQYTICGNMKRKAADSHYEVELIHHGEQYSMYPRLQKAEYLDMYPYGGLTIDGKRADYDLCIELYRNQLAAPIG